MTSIHKLRVGRADLHRTDIAEQPAELAPGQALFAVESFALTANNITYAAHGEDMGYWRFYPAAEGWGIVPVWGFGRVVDAGDSGLEPGARVYGYWPMASHAVLTPANASPRGFTDGSAWRAELPAVYNAYQPAAAVRGDEHVYSLFRPLYVTSFLIDDQLADDTPDADTVILSSASSKTALGLAQALKARGVPAIGLTSAANVGFTEATGYYDRVLSYDAVEQLPGAARPVFVDFAGNGELRGRVHARYGDSLAASVIVGDTHWDVPGGGAPLPGPKPAFFFAPTRLVKRMGEWGGPGFHDRLETSWEVFTGSTSPWLKVVEERGSDAVQRRYLQTLEGGVAPDTGLILSF